MMDIILKKNIIRKFILENECLRFFVLASLVFYSYGIFISGLNMGAADAHWYQNILHDALIQLDHGIFPTYVGQSQFNFFGSSNMRSPYYLLFGQFLHLLTFGKLNALYIQHLTVFVSAFTAAFISYFFCTQLAPEHRWASLVFAFLYISCPGIIGLIYHCDMYHSFMAIPYVPLAIYGIIRTHQKDDYLGYIITSIALSLALMAHPPIAIWTAGICFFFYSLRIIYIRKGFLGFFIIPCLLFVLNFWQFASIQELGLRDYLNELPNPGYTDWIMKLINGGIPDVLLPLGWGSNQSVTPFLQFGYSFWFVALVGFIIATRPSCNFVIRALVACALFLLVLLYPVPLLTKFLWLQIPDSLHTLTMWPMQRFYPILGILATFIGILLIKKYSSTSHARLLTPVLVLMFSWNIYQTFYFIHYARTVVKSSDNFWLQPENMYFITNGLLPVYNNISIGHFDPTLKNLILDEKQEPIDGYDNEQQVINKCLQHLTIPSQAMINKTQQKFPLHFTSLSTQHILKFDTPSDEHLLLCLKTNLNNATINVAIVKPQKGMNTSLDGSISTYNNKKPSTKIFSIPIFHSNIEELNIYASATFLNDPKLNEPSTAVIESYGLVSYDPEQLPIHIDSTTPYKASVETKTPNTYLKIFKSYFPGYEAKVDGENVPVLASKDSKMVMIPLKNKGPHQIELFYVGTPIMKLSFYISALAWTAVLMAFTLLGYRKYRVKKPSKIAFAISD